ncbi:AbrB/MazE/SpoVT family DNA-binding domain-containing protein [Glaciimonas immobilis]|uniref:Antitoxin component of MazEF toxin-antitoxin module n=1 Tax=Glaciimonas immobilis TaxID=728004 RepID=A0A840RY22_9BURK|nr:AbrB/MazE/SpoVT family DNA-binding domain-containing protein [Glaciimonas immobilis]MBB5202463.1 antitoxin component of MazEF toxin-antitoxin module [Glaciimonas immobilis]
MKTSIRKIGNSQGVLIPKPFLAQVGMKIGDIVSISRLKTTELLFEN